jgi:nicotinate-nucleotide adenylyltransferase
MDMLSDLFSWKEAENLINLIKFIGVPRKGYPFELLDGRLKQKVHLITMPLIEISGKTIRERLRNRLPVRFWVPDVVDEYLQETQLYLNS